MIAALGDNQPVEISAGVTERVILEPVSSAYKTLRFSLLSLTTEAEIEIAAGNDERIYFVLDGRGTISVRWLQGSWRYPVRADMAVRIPFMTHHIQNRGDGVMRCLSVACRHERAIDDRYLFVDLVDMRQQSSVNSVYGVERAIFSPDALQGSGSKLNLCVYDTLFPGGSTDFHVPTDHCEETMYVVRGSASMTIGNEKSIVHPGDTGHVMPGTLHREENSGDEPFEYFVFESHSDSPRVPS
jgi:mannose-6-phosphate isomerase-like protein (cupin superfamily)